MTRNPFSQPVLFTLRVLLRYRGDRPAAHLTADRQKFAGLVRRVPGAGQVVQRAAVRASWSADHSRVHHAYLVVINRSAGRSSRLDVKLSPKGMTIVQPAITPSMISLNFLTNLLLV